MAAERRRPMTKQEYRQMKKMQEKARRQKEREAWEAARGPMDLPFFLLAMLLLTIGLVMLLSASFPSAQASSNSGYNPLYYFQRQAMWAGLGLFAMFWVSKINYHRFEGLAKLAMIISIVLLILVILPGPKANGKLLGITHNGATRWLGIPGMGTMQFQPSEVAKVGLIVFFAQSISKKREKMKTFREGFLYHVVILAAMCALTMIEPHLSGAILIFGIGASMLVVGVTVQIALQAFLNMAVVTNLIPNTGISLPFFSYGGTALAIQLAEVGMVLSVSRQIPAPRAE